MYTRLRQCHICRAFITAAQQRNDEPTVKTAVILAGANNVASQLPSASRLLLQARNRTEENKVRVTYPDYLRTSSHDKTVLLLNDDPPQIEDGYTGLILHVKQAACC